MFFSLKCLSLFLKTNRLDSHLNAALKETKGNGINHTCIYSTMLIEIGISIAGSIITT